MFRMQVLLVVVIGCLLDLVHGMAPRPTRTTGSNKQQQSQSRPTSRPTPVRNEASWPLSPPQPLEPIPQISKSQFHPLRNYYSNFQEDCGRPILIQGVLSEEECETCCEQLLSAADTLQVDLQQQSSENGGTQIFPCTLSQAINVIMRKSNSQVAYLAFCEGLLVQQQETPLQELQDKVNHAKNSLFGKEDEDWFQWFPNEAQPTDAVILAGAGATSTLHRDPMEWTGTSLCLEGSKIWRFLEPPQQQGGGCPEQRVVALDKALQCYRLPSIAWQREEENYNGETTTTGAATSLSSGWQSDFSLYYHRNHAAIPSAQSIAEMDEDKRQALLETLALDWTILSPNLPVDVSPRVHTVVQKAGDLLLIPPHWWHQTYGFEPSVAIASQRCGTVDAERVFQHILSQKKIQSSPRFQPEADRGTAKSILDSSQGPAEAVMKLFQNL